MSLEWVWEWADESALAEVVNELAQFWCPPAVVLLEGAMGSGKTTLTKYLFSRLGVSARVKSPTFDLVHTYQLGAQSLVHVDLYRLGVEEDLDSLDLPKPDEADTMLIVEWGQPLALRYPDRFDATILVVGSHARRMTVSAHGAHSEARLGEWMCGSRSEN